MNDSKKFNRIYFLFLAVVVCSLSMCGCGKKLNESEKILLSSGALAARERAIAFNMIGAMVIAKEEKNNVHVALFAKSHAAALISDAKALADINKAAAAGALKDQSFAVFKSVAQNAKANAQNFTAIKEHIAVRPNTVPPAQWIQYIETHEAALNQLAVVLKEIADKLQKEKEKPKNETPD